MKETLIERKTHVMLYYPVLTSIVMDPPLTLLSDVGGVGRMANALETGILRSTPGMRSGFDRILVLVLDGDDLESFDFPNSKTDRTLANA